MAENNLIRKELWRLVGPHAGDYPDVDQFVETALAEIDDLGAPILAVLTDLRQLGKEGIAPSIAHILEAIRSV